MKGIAYDTIPISSSSSGCSYHVKQFQNGIC